MSPSKYDPCKRGCCWTPFGACGKQRNCLCHSTALALWLAAREPKPDNNVLPFRLDHKDPTGETAVGNIMRSQRRKR